MHGLQNKDFENQIGRFPERNIKLLVFSIYIVILAGRQCCEDKIVSAPRKREISIFGHTDIASVLADGACKTNIQADV